REREEEQRERREQAQQPDGAHAKLEPENISGYIFAQGIVEIEIDCLARVLTQMLQPAMASLPCGDNHGWQKEAPGKEPHQMQHPVPEGGQLVVVVRVAHVEEAQHVFIDEVEIEEAVDIADRRVVADGMALIRIVQAAKNVPGGGNREKEQKAGQR